MAKVGAPVAAAVGVAAAVVYTHPGLGADLRHHIPVVSKVFAAAAAGNQPDRAPKSAGHGVGIPKRYRVLYQKAGAGSCINWRVLAAIGYVESRHGANTGPSAAGALGPMQFMPATWRVYGRDGNHDGRKNIHDPADAIPAAAHYLCANGAGRDLRGAIWHYNHSWNYVDLVLATSRRVR
jgi:membrane-bound lytic murein transglycosylase B